MHDLNFDHLRSITTSGLTPLFATVSGAHLYGFPSPDSDVDLRGAFVLPVKEVIRLREPVETLTTTHTAGGTEVDWVAHDVRKLQTEYLFGSVKRARQEAILNGAYSLSSVSTIKLSPALEESIGTRSVLDLTPVIPYGKVTMWYNQRYIGYCQGSPTAGRHSCWEAGHARLSLSH